MAVILEDYDAMYVPDFNPVTGRFFVPLDNASDITLADLATELNGYNNRVWFEGRTYIADGVKKQMNPVTYEWSAVLNVRRV